MSGHTTDISDSSLWETPRGSNGSSGWALILAWSFEEPGRLGESGWIPDRGHPRVLGRGEAEAGEAEERLFFGQQRPGRTTPTGILAGSRISRRQLVLTPSPASLTVQNVGRCGLLVNGRPVERAELTAGDTILLKNQLLLVCTRRPSRLPRTNTLNEQAWGAFGVADAMGIVGESLACWKLRDEQAFCARRDAHVLVTGPSGVGKELTARALHSMSTRCGRPLVARNAATFPEGLIDAELFGNMKNYPNPGMVERPGLVGEASGSTLFLDEIGELDGSLQAHLLRVLDTGGEYQRLGESMVRRSDLRLVAATNRSVEALKHDLVGRLTLHLSLPGLDQRPEDIPLLARHLLAVTAAKDAGMRERFFDGWGTPAAVARLDPQLMERLLRHRYGLHVRELDQLLWKAMVTSRGRVIHLTEEVRAMLTEPPQHADPGTLSREAVLAALERNQQNRTRTAADLGLKNRDVLYRLMRRLRID